MAKELTPEQIKARQEWIGVDGESDEDFQKAFNTKYVPAATLHETEQFKRAIGNTLGSITTKLKGHFKTHGLELSNEDIKDKSLEDIVNVGLGKIVEQHGQAFEAEKAKNNGKPSEREKALEADLLKIKGDYSVIESANKKQKEEFETERTNWSANAKKQNIDNFKGKLWGSYAWGTENELERTGFQAKIDSKYDFDLDEKGNGVIIDRATGNKIPNPKVNSTFLSPEDILQKEGIENKVYKLNPDGGKPATPPAAPGTTQPTELARRPIFADTIQ